MEKQDGLYCGYAPRVLRRLANRKSGEEVLFVGCKDGSLTVLRRDVSSRSYEVLRHLGRDPGHSLAKTVRVLLDYRSDHLVVGRDDGGLELINWRAPDNAPGKAAFLPGSEEAGESVRYAAWLDRSQTRLLVAFRHAGTRVLFFQEPLSGQEDLGKSLEASVQLEAIGGIRVAAGIPDPRTPTAPPGSFVLVDKEGVLWLWDSRPADRVPPPRALGKWSAAELPPATFEDATYVGPAPRGVYKDICALVVTTDTGVFALDLREEGWEEAISSLRGGGPLPERWPRPIRLALPGGSRFCTAVTYSEVDSPEGTRGQLWLTNREGESLLFENGPLGMDGDFQSWVLGFRGSGRFQLESQALTAVSWAAQGQVLLAQACRDDRVRIFSYSVVRQDFAGEPLPETDLLRLRCSPDAGQRLRPFLLDALRRRDNVKLRDWPGYALLAELFDLRAAGPGSTDDFFEYLIQPYTEVPVAILAAIPSEEEEKDASMHLAAAVRLWTLCLLGIVNRHRWPREEWYLGILRFLLSIREAVRHEAAGLLVEEHQRTLASAIERAIRFTRKWGLYGRANEIRQNLVSPLKILQAQYGEDGALLDQMTYYSLLFRRSYSEVAEDVTKQQEGDQAWAVKTLELGCGTLVAGSWRRQGIAFFVLESKDRLSPRLVRVVMPEELRRSSQPEAQVDRDRYNLDRDRYNFSRDILLLPAPEGGNRFNLLQATRTSKTSDFMEDLSLLSLELVCDGESWKVDCLGKRRLPAGTEGKHGSIYRFLDLERDASGAHLVAVGLGGKYGVGEIALVDISGIGDLKDCGAFSLSDFGSEEVAGGVQSPDLKSFRNRVWSLAKLGPGGTMPAGASNAFLAGCDNGEIWYVELRGGERSQIRLVARLTSAVKALHTALVGGRIRVFAGTKDGTAVAFQELERKDVPYPYLAALWATVESEEICHLERHPYTLGEEHFVLAVTRNGVCVAFDDCERAAPFKPEKKSPQRPPFPGMRWLRIATERTCFAATSFENLHDIGQSAWRLVATASGDGCVRVISLHLPRYSLLRKEQFLSQCGRLWKVADEELMGADPSPAGDRAFRAVEAAYRSAPLLPLIIVRMILDPGIEAQGWLPEIKEARSWCLPQNMRPVLELRQRWDEVLLKDASKSEIDEVGKALAAGLDAAWAGRDVDLFQEICALTLKRLNGQLFRPEGLNAESLRKVYFSLFDVMRGRLQLWLGSPDRGELRSRIVVAKNLLDGDTFYDLSQRAAHDPEGPWKNILLKRVEGAVELILVGNDLVSLEALRAANHSLVRLCRRFSEARQSAGGGLRSLRWEFFQNYFSQIVHGAVQRLDANLRLGDAMANEYSRTFALSFYACPEALLNITSDLVDSRLIRDPHSEDDFTRSIEGQVEILSDLFDLHGFAPLWNFVKEVHLHFSVDKLPESDEAEAGEWEREMSKALDEVLDVQDQDWLQERLREYGNLYRFVAKWKRFAHSLSTSARNLGLATRDGIQHLKDAIPPEGKRGVFPHSWAFWDSAMKAFSQLAGCPEEATDRIRPETILFVKQISRWAEDGISDLEKRYSNGSLFEPEHGVFREVLSRVERAAREFPSSAAVQKNLVVGILGHHLLEDLDLHVLELREIARNLHPAQKTLEGQRDGQEDVAGRFASLLVRRSQRAQSLPKNLRALSKVLEPSPETLQSSGGVKSLFREGMWDLSAWTKGDFRIANAREREFLALILSELEQNHSIHSGFKDDARFYPLLEWSKECLTARFPVSRDGADRWQLVEEVVSDHGQKPFKPNPSPGVSSTGVGLYLSCLAASMVGWRMELKAQKEISKAKLGGWLVVELFPPAATERLTGESPASDADAAHWTAVPRKPFRNVVVIDDKPEVALYVWRELGEVPGFSIGEAGKALSAGPLRTPSGDIRVWWVPATERWRAQLDELLDGDELQGGTFFLVDVRGPVAGSRDSGTGPVYKVREVLSTIQGKRAEDFPGHVWLISSYEHGTRAAIGTDKPIEIRSKSPDTLSKLRKFLRGEESGRIQASEAVHVLVTGAGFEFRGAPRDQQLGMLPTGELLRRWIKSVYGKRPLRRVGFPVPPSFAHVEDLRRAAKEGDLDRYWSSILREERAAAKGDVLEIVAKEYDLRRRFRAEFVRHDWGHLPQALAAARMGWSAWVSTNYTRFANRAIEICGREWLTVEFGEEAQHLSHQLLYGAAGLRGKSILFKVHGDIGHVLTMALSTEDKTIETRLSSFMPLYLAAERYLHELTRKNKAIVWHIVGHGLKDELLMHVIRTACEIDPGQHRFVVIAPDSKGSKHPALELQAKLDPLKSPILGRHATADIYLTRLEKVGLGRYEEVLGELEEVPMERVG